MDETHDIKAKIRHLYELSVKADQIKMETDRLKEELLPTLEARGLTKTKFDFGDRIIGCTKRMDYQSLSQKLLKEHLETNYPNLDKGKFMGELLGLRKQTPHLSLDIIRKRPKSK